MIGLTVPCRPCEVELVLIQGAKLDKQGVEVIVNPIAASPQGMPDVLSENRVNLFEALHFLPYMPWTSQLFAHPTVNMSISIDRKS